MSGIVGIINLDGQPLERELLDRLTAYLVFRGPDGQGVWFDGPVGFGHTQLCTTFESEREQQPLSLDGQVWITADARIDGRADLIRKLKARGCADLKNIPDVELILYAYKAWGDDCLLHLIGDFAFAIWDGPRRLLFAARDHLGVKPFYYAQPGRSLVFSNTLNCIRMHPQVSDELNDLAIADFLLFDFNQDLATTTYADIRRIPPAHYLTWQEGVLHVNRYWTLPMEDPLRYKRQRDYVEHFKELLQRAVADRLRAGRVGVSMSGGLDSSIVAAIAKDFLSKQARPCELQACTVVYDRLIPDQERYYSGMVAAHLNLPIHYLAADDYQLYERWDQPELQWPEPNHDPLASIWIDLVKQFVGQSRVILTGEGGDPLLCPSKSYFYKMLKSLRWGQLAMQTARCLFTYRRLPPIGFKSGLRRWWRGNGNTPSISSWLNPHFVVRLGLTARWAQIIQEPFPSHPIRNEAYQGIISSYWQNFFERYFDPGVIGLPVEFYHPFFDLRLVKYALSLPPLPWCIDKVILREASQGLLPEAIRHRPKSPLAKSPIMERIMKGEVRCLDSFVFTPRLADYVNKEKIYLVSEENESEQMWTNLRVFSLNCWLQSQRNVI
jgi:asparagine synthase (glutamine-hydrolysing)